MIETIKKSILWWFIFSLTIWLLWFTYASIANVSDWDTLTSDMWNSMVWNFNYSYSEIDTGKTWLDWTSKIYKKTIFLPVWTWYNNQSINSTIPHWISSIGSVVDIQHVFMWAWNWTNSSIFWVKLNDTNLLVSHDSSAWWSSYWYITVYYTK